MFVKLIKEPIFHLKLHIKPKYVYTYLKEIIVPGLTILPPAAINYLKCKAQYQAGKIPVELLVKHIEESSKIK